MALIKKNPRNETEFLSQRIDKLEEQIKFLKAQHRPTVPIYDSIAGFPPDAIEGQVAIDLSGIGGISGLGALTSYCDLTHNETVPNGNGYGYDFAGDVLQTNDPSTFSLEVSTGPAWTGKTGISIHTPGTYLIIIQGQLFEGTAVTSPETVWTQSEYFIDTSISGMVTFLDGVGNGIGGGYGAPQPLPNSSGAGHHAWTHNTFVSLVQVNTDLGTNPIIGIVDQDSGQSLNGFYTIQIFKIDSLGAGSNINTFPPFAIASSGGANSTNHIASGSSPTIGDTTSSNFWTSDPNIFDSIISPGGSWPAALNLFTIKKPGTYYVKIGIQVLDNIGGNAVADPTVVPFHGDFIANSTGGSAGGNDSGFMSSNDCQEFGITKEGFSVGTGHSIWTLNYDRLYSIGSDAPTPIAPIGTQQSGKILYWQWNMLVVQLLPNINLFA